MLENCASTLFVGVVQSAGSRCFARLSGLRGERDDAAGSAVGSAVQNATGSAGRALAGDIEQQFSQERDRLALLLDAQRHKPRPKKLGLDAVAHASPAPRLTNSGTGSNTSEAPPQNQCASGLANRTGGEPNDSPPIERPVCAPEWVNAERGNPSTQAILHTLHERDLLPPPPRDRRAVAST
jgi:hypothetical protein